MPLQDANPTPSFGGFGLRMTRWSLFLQTLSLLHHFLGLYSSDVVDQPAAKVAEVQDQRERQAPAEDYRWHRSPEPRATYKAAVSLVHATSLYDAAR